MWLLRNEYNLRQNDDTVEGDVRADKCCVFTLLRNDTQTHRFIPSLSWQFANGTPTHLLTVQ